MNHVIVIGGGLAGLATAAALGGSGYRVDLLEARGFLGGRATSYPAPGQDEAETIDNCQHILLRCCVNLLDFYRRLGVEKCIEFHRDFFFIEPGGRTSILKRGLLPTPFHFTESFARLTFLSLREKLAVGRAILAMRSQRNRRTDLDSITMLDWLKEQKQPPQAIERFWRQVLVSAINEELDRMAASHGFQVFWLGFLARSNSYEMGVPSVPLGELYNSSGWSRIANVSLQERTAVEKILIDGSQVAGVQSNGSVKTADFYVSAVPFERAVPLGIPAEVDGFGHSPITGIHLWFDRPVTELPHATLLDRTIQWAFVKQGGRYVQLVVSASRNLLEMRRGEVIDLALKELAEFFPAARQAKLEKAHVVKEVRATFSACPGLESKRPLSRTPIANLFLAGDWTKSGWPATMEGAVRSGYKAAEAVTAAAGNPQQFVLPDIA